MGFLVANFIRRTLVGGVSYFTLTRSKNGKKKDGHWFLDTDGGQERIYISCPFCGKLYDISAHEVRPDGIVLPCIPCDAGGCNRYLHVILKKWDLGHRAETVYRY